MKNKGYAKFGVANMVHYGKCASGVLPNSNQGGLDTSLCIMTHIVRNRAAKFVKFLSLVLIGPIFNLFQNLKIFQIAR